MDKSILSVIILNYNSGQYLSGCLRSIEQSKLNKYHLDVIVVDNHSSDNSFTQARKMVLHHPQVSYTFLTTPQNLGFAAGNNYGLKKKNPQSKYILFLNDDTVVGPTSLYQMIDFFEKNPKADAATCALILAATDKLQPECHRGFPTLLNSFWHFFGCGIPRLFPRSSFFNGYFQSHLDYSQTQQIDACSGAFLMVKKEAGDRIGWWDESFFFYGEDLDFCYRLKEAGYKLFFYPGSQVTHFQGISSGIIDSTKNITQASRQTKVNSAKASTQAMKIFFAKHYSHKYGPISRQVVLLVIDLMATLRILKAKLL